MTTVWYYWGVYILIQWKTNLGRWIARERSARLTDVNKESKKLMTNWKQNTYYSFTSSESYEECYYIFLQHQIIQLMLEKRGGKRGGKINS